MIALLSINQMEVEVNGEEIKRHYGDGKVNKPLVNSKITYILIDGNEFSRFTFSQENWHRYPQS